MSRQQTQLIGKKSMRFRDGLRLVLLAAAVLAVGLSLFAACQADAVAENDRIQDVVQGATAELYEEAEDVAKESPNLGRDFTDHKIDHAIMVSAKSVEAAEAFQEAAERGTLPTTAEEGRIPFSKDVDLAVVAAAGLAHDTGMRGGGYAIDVVDDPDGSLSYAVVDENLYHMHPETISDFAEIRTFHSLNSCMYVLTLRPVLVEAGFTDQEVDRIAAECAAHSKSSSGVKDLNSREHWDACFDRILSIVKAWNEDHPEEPIQFDRTAFETDDALMSRLATETLALRVGDVSRDSGPDAEVQSGEHVHVDRSTLNDRGNTIEKELEGASVTYVETGESVDSLKGRQVHAGEQNIVFNRTYVNDEGMVVHEITITDGCSAPRCTQSSVGDHLGEFYSARDGEFLVRIIFEHFEAEDPDFFRNSWEEYRLMAANDYPNVGINFPWDEEVSK